MVAQIIRNANSSSNTSTHDKWGSQYVKGMAPSKGAIQAEEEFKALCGEMKGLKYPSFGKYTSKYFWSKINKIKDQELQKQYYYMINRIQEGMMNSHPGIWLDELNLHEVFDFVLGVDHMVMFNSVNYKGSKLLGFDVTTNPYATQVKVNKTHKAYRGAKLGLLKEFGFDGYIVVLWQVKEYEYRNKKELANQLLKGLSEWRPETFTHIVNIT